ncbi:hypothetical protein FACS1894182_09860 [Bacteroidia bacterium]|nr:hypothetical protein FACS1894182_09860 [Bacteroidia bacterium]
MMRKFILYFGVALTFFIGVSTNTMAQDKKIKKIRKECYYWEVKNGKDIKGAKKDLPSDDVWLIEISSYPNGKIFQKKMTQIDGSYTVNEYDTLGKINKSSMYASDNKIIAYTLYRYDSHARRMNEVDFDGRTNDVQYKIRYTYSDTGKDYEAWHFNRYAQFYIKEQYVYQNDLLYRHYHYGYNYRRGENYVIEYEYDKNDHKISEEKYSLSPEVSKSDETFDGVSVHYSVDVNDYLSGSHYVYDENGNMLIEEYENNQFETKRIKNTINELYSVEECKVRHIYTYNEKGNIISYSKYYIECKTGRENLYSKEYTIYNESDAIVENGIFYYDTDLSLNEKIIYRYSYKYNEMNHIVEIKTYINDQPSSIVETQYEYW